ncbi:MAG TPA: hypothetical protein VNN08_22480 [Thermoanaerobaculia bacterium]|nr:hypothetical protein [Thermoanaerobaculia bacterium]
MRTLRVLTASLIIAASADAAIRVTANGEPAAGAEVCGFRAASAATPFRQLLSANEIVCGAALPPGLWNVFARRGSAQISSRSVLVDTREPLPDVELRLEPAASISFSALPQGTHGVVYVTDSVSAFPAGSDGVALVPAERDLLPLAARDGVPVAVGEPLRLSAGARQAAAFGPSASRAVATWVSIAPADLAALRTARRKQPPQVAAKGARFTVAPINPLRGTIVLDRAMQFLRVPAGASTLEVSGTPWKRESLAVDVPPSGIVVTASALRLIPTSSAIVKWAARRDLTALASNRTPPCPGPKEPKAAPPRPVVSLLSCRGYQPARALQLLDREQCSVVGARDWPAPQRNGEVAFESLDPGSYVIEFTFAGLPPIREPLRLGHFDQENVNLDVDYNTLYGRVTVGGEKVSSPVRVAFDFVHAVYTSDDGDYSVVLNKPLAADRVISLRSCDGSVDGERIVEHDVFPNSRYDIDLPANGVTVEAVDAESNAPVAGAGVRYGAFRGDEMSSVYYFRLAYAPDSTGNNVPIRTGPDGRYLIRNLPPEKTLRVCLEHDDYERTCAEPLTLTSTQTKTVHIAMKPKKGFGGSIVGANDVAAGQLYWFAADGRETERTVVKPDGTFHFNLRHDPGEAVVFVSANLPLFAFPQPFLGEHDPMDVTMPPSVSRTFSVSIDEERRQESAVVTIEIGGLVVPYPPFAQHLALHGSQLDLRNRGPLLVPDILQTGPISVILGPPTDQVTPAMRAIDLFRLPQFRGLPRRPVGGEGSVVFALPRVLTIS